MTDYRFSILITAEDGEQVALPILVHELYSKPFRLKGVPEWASDDDIKRAVAQLEEKLGYELEQPNNYGEVRLSDDEAAEYYPKTAGFDPVTEELVAR